VNKCCGAAVLQVKISYELQVTGFGLLESLEFVGLLGFTS